MSTKSYILFITLVWHCHFLLETHIFVNFFCQTHNISRNRKILNSSIFTIFSNWFGVNIKNSSYSLPGIFVSIMVFLLMKIIASKLRKSRFRNKSSTGGNRADNVVCDGQSAEIFTVPSENKIIINNFHLVINSCECTKCQNCPEKSRVFENCENSIDQELLLSVMKSKFPNLWL